MTNFERLMLCKTPEEAFQVLRAPEGHVPAAWCANTDVGECYWKCDRCLDSWLLSDYRGQTIDEYKPRHMRVDA